MPINAARILYLSMERRARLMSEVMARLGIDVEGAVSGDTGLALWEAGRGCALCGRAARCARWLAEGTDPEGYRAFCPNAGLLDRLPRTRKR